MPKNRSKVFITVNNVKYYLAHTGLAGNQSYQIYGRLGHRIFYLELRKDVNQTWTFHVERKEKLVFDSGLGKAFYTTPEEAHSVMISELHKKYIPNL